MNAEQFHASWGVDPIPTDPHLGVGVVTVSCDLGADRPDADLLRRIADQLETQPERILVALAVSYAPGGHEGLLVGTVVLGGAVELDEDGDQ